MQRTASAALSFRVFALALAVSTATWLAACGGGGGVSVAPGPTAAPATLPLVDLVPASGGNLTLATVSQITPALSFVAGAPSGTTITANGSAMCPSNAPLPLALARKAQSVRATAQATPNPGSVAAFFCVTFTVSQTIPATLLSSESVSGALPTNAEAFDAELDDITSATGVALQAMAGTPVTPSNVKFDGPTGTTQLAPGRKYLMRFIAAREALLPMTFTNKSGIANAYYSIIGFNPDTSDNHFYYVTSSGQLAPTEIADGTLAPNSAVNYLVTKYTYPFPPAGETIPLPLMRAGRIYVSVGAPVVIQLNACGVANTGVCPSGISPENGVVAYPNGWGSSTDPDYNIMFDWIEFNYLIDPGTHLPSMGPNTTAVQMFGLPLSQTLTSATGVVEASGFKPEGGGRTAIYNAIEMDPNFKNLIVPGPAEGTSLSPRIISADNGIRNQLNNIPGVPHFDPSEYASYIAAVWAKYQTEDLTMYTSAYGTWAGRVNPENEMVFTPPPTESYTTPIVIKYPEPTDVIIGEGTLASQACPNITGTDIYNVCGEIGSSLSAAFNRSTLLAFPYMTRKYPPYTECDYNDFYQASPVNEYAKLLHANNLPVVNAYANAPNGGVYAFGYDDNCNESSLLVDANNPSAYSMTIEPF